jgi:hypothetical protein
MDKIVESKIFWSNREIVKTKIKIVNYFLVCTKATIKDETILETIQRSQEKAKILEATVEFSDINLDNFETVFKFDGKNYQKADQDLSSAFFRDIKLKYQLEEIVTISDDEEDGLVSENLVKVSNSFSGNDEFIHILQGNIRNIRI